MKVTKHVVEYVEVEEVEYVEEGEVGGVDEQAWFVRAINGDLAIYSDEEEAVRGNRYDDLRLDKRATLTALRAVIAGHEGTDDLRPMKVGRRQGVFFAAPCGAQRWFPIAQARKLLDALASLKS